MEARRSVVVRACVPCLRRGSSARAAALAERAALVEPAEEPLRRTALVLVVRARQAARVRVRVRVKSAAVEPTRFPRTRR